MRLGLAMSTMFMLAAVSSGKEPTRSEPLPEPPPDPDPDQDVLHLHPQVAADFRASMKTGRPDRRAGLSQSSERLAAAEAKRARRAARNLRNRV